VQNDFNKGILEEVAHRPWPMPRRAWLMTQTWHDLLFAHWPVSADLLASKIPKRFELDTFDGRAWLGIVPFHMTNVAPRWVPALPWVSEFPELNVRTYVRVDGKPGVYFFSLDAGNALAVQAARRLLNLPYFSADMVVAGDGDRVSYRSRRRPPNDAACFEGSYRPTGGVFQASPGTLEYFLTERYCLFGVSHAYRAYRLDIHHPPWPLQAAEAEIAGNTMAEASGIELPSMAPLLHFAKRQDMVAWPPETI
jgi:uncharacterized protein